MCQYLPQVIQHSEAYIAEQIKAQKQQALATHLATIDITPDMVEHEEAMKAQEQAMIERHASELYSQSRQFMTQLMRDEPDANT